MASTQKLWQQNNNRLYWEKRERRQRELYMAEEAEQQKEINKIYSEMYRWAEDEINRFYGKYANAEGIDITEAKKRVTQLDIEEYERLAKQYVKDKNFSDRANAEMRLYNATMKINRLEMLQARIGVHLVDGINTLDEYYETQITDRTREEIERQAGILGETVSVADTTKRARNIVNASFFNATYSDRIWSHQDRLRSMISIELQRGLIAGVGSREMAQRIKKEFDVSASDAHRLMVTELRRVQTDVAMDSYKQSGVERYVYMAVNPRACPICLELDGKDFPVSEAEPAKNAPPMHPRCHCTTAPYVDEDDYNAWLNYLSQGGSTSDWNKMSLTERQKYKQPVVQSNNNTIATRADAERVLKDDVGFETLMTGLGNLPDDVLIKQTEQLRTLEKKFGAVHGSVHPKIGADKNGGGTFAYVSHYIKDINTQSLHFCANHFSSITDIISEMADLAKRKYFMPSNDYIVYTVTHEYGHMLHNVLLTNDMDSFQDFKTRATTTNGRYKAYDKYRDKTLNQYRTEIIDIAKQRNPNFDINANLSRYGMTNPAEFFAEVFANSQGGQPNELGDAMNEWLRGRGYA